MMIFQKNFRERETDFEFANDISFEPTLLNLYKDDIAPLRRMEAHIAGILMGRPEPNTDGLAIVVACLPGRKSENKVDRVKRR